MSNKVTKKEQDAIDKLLGKKDYYVVASETVYYRKRVKAHSEEDAREMVATGDVDFGEPMYGQNFEVVSIEEDV